MSDYKEFLGKTLDAAIAEACSYYDCAREKLEIDILEDSKSGIFGIVGARKARIRVRRAPTPTRAYSTERITLSKPGSEAFEILNGPDSVEVGDKDLASPVPSANKAEQPEDEQGIRTEEIGRHDEKSNRRREKAPREKKVSVLTPPMVPDMEDEDAVGNRIPEAEGATVHAEADKRHNRGDRTEGRGRRAPSLQKSPERGERPERAEHPERAERPERTDKTKRPERRPCDPQITNLTSVDERDLAQDAAVDSLPRMALMDLDQDKLREVTLDVVSRMVLPIAGEAPLEFTVSGDRVRVKIDCEDTGLLIGREGQNLAAMQYLAARMITRRMESLVRVQLDTGDYHSRQDGRLRDLAKELAEKFRATGKAQSTRPMSAYQRRVVHLALQDEPDIQTRSMGEGTMKRVLVLRRKD